MLTRRWTWLASLGLAALLAVPGGAGAVANGPGKAAPAARPAGRPPAAPEFRDTDGDRILENLAGRLRTARPGERLPVLMLFRTPLDQVDLAGLVPGVGTLEVERRLPLVNGISARLTPAQVRALARAPAVSQVELNGVVQAQLDTAGPWAGVQAARAESGLTGAGTVICVVDTGIDAGHVDLDGGKVVAWTDLVNGRPSPYDDNGHGTHVAGLAAGTGEGNSAYRGVAPAASLIGAKVLNSSGSGSFDSVIAGIDFCVQQKREHGYKLVLNLSLGASGSADGTDAVSRAVNNAAAAGVVPVVAAGNGGPGARTVGTPAAAADAITVGAMADPGENGWFLAYFSGRGPTADGRIKPDIAAPGYNIMAPRAGSTNGYVSYSGTSMATPFTAGIAALMLEGNGTLAPADVKRLLTTAGAVDWGTAGPDNEFGAGRVDGYAAVQAACAAPGASPCLSGSGPAQPAHAFVSGSLSGTGDADWYDIAVTDAAFPIAITLVIPNWNFFSPDFDLALYNPAGSRVAAATGVDRQETLTHRPAGTGTYRLRVYSYSGSGSYQFDQSAGTGAPDTVPPGQPGAPTVAVPVSNGDRLDVSWPANPPADGVDHYDLYRSDAEGSLGSRVATVSGTAHTDTGLTPGAAYYYRVQAVDAAGNVSTPSAPGSGTTVDNRAPAISNVAASVGRTEATISWNTDETASGYVEYWAAGSGGSHLATAATSGRSFSHTLSGLAEDTAYNYVIHAADGAGNASTASGSFTTGAAPAGWSSGNLEAGWSDTGRRSGKTAARDYVFTPPAGLAFTTVEVAVRGRPSGGNPTVTAYIRRKSADYEVDRTLLANCSPEPCVLASAGAAAGQVVAGAANTLRLTVGILYQGQSFTVDYVEVRLK